MHIKDILVPVDFSPPSTVAVNYGISLARKFRATLTLLHVIEPATALIYTFPTASEEVQAARIERAERMLGAMLGPEDQDDLDLRLVVKVGDIESEIIAGIHETLADVVVMGTHGRRLLGRWLTGSVTHALLRKVDVPILTVCHVGGPMAFKKILFATDIANPPAEDLTFVLEFAKAVGAIVVAVHVIEEQSPITYETPDVASLFDTDWRRVHEETRIALDAMESEARGRGVSLERVIAKGVPAEVIVRIADEYEADFIVMGIRKKGRVERALLGTTAERVVREAHVPVLSISMP